MMEIVLSLSNALRRMGVGRSFLIAAIITISAPLLFIFSHRLEDKDYIMFKMLVYATPAMFLFVFPKYIIPHLINAKNAALFSALLLLLAGIFFYEISIADLPIKKEEGIRAGAIFQFSIIINFYIALLLPSDRFQN